MYIVHIIILFLLQIYKMPNNSSPVRTMFRVKYPLLGNKQNIFKTSKKGVYVILINGKAYYVLYNEDGTFGKSRVPFEEIQWRKLKEIKAGRRNLYYRDFQTQKERDDNHALRELELQKRKRKMLPKVGHGYETVSVSPRGTTVTTESDEIPATKRAKI
jgi:hypothetical protein